MMIMPNTNGWTPEKLFKTFVDYILNTPIEDLEKSIKNDVLDEEEDEKVGTFRGIYCYPNPKNKEDYIFYLVTVIEEKDTTIIRTGAGFGAPFLSIELNKKTKGLKLLDGSLCGIKESKMMEVIDKLKKLFELQKKRKKLFGIF